MEQKLNIEVTGNELTIREGKALDLKPKEKVSLSGTITAPGDYALTRASTFDKLSCNVLANYTSRTIVLTINEGDPLASTIKGTLDIFPELETLGVNKNRMYSEKELYSKLNFFGRYFSDKAAHKDLLTKLQQFKAKVQRDFVNADDYKGTAAIEKITKIEHEIPLSFQLNIPIFTGGAHKTFTVNINITATDGGISFWFESVDMHEIISRETDSIFSLELDRLSNFLVVKQW